MTNKFMYLLFAMVGLLIVGNSSSSAQSDINFELIGQIGRGTIEDVIWHPDGSYFVVESSLGGGNMIMS